MERVTEERVFEALRQVEDPELHRDIVSLGMVKNLAVAQGNVRFTVELTTPACPLRETIENDCKKALAEIGGIAITRSPKCDSNASRNRATASGSFSTSS